MSAIWCCTRCGRWGTRAFIIAPNDDKARVCANDRACARRATQKPGDPVQADADSLESRGIESSSVDHENGSER